MNILLEISYDIDIPTFKRDDIVYIERAKLIGKIIKINFSTNYYDNSFLLTECIYYDLGFANFYDATYRDNDWSINSGLKNKPFKYGMYVQKHEISVISQEIMDKLKREWDMMQVLDR